MKFSTIALAGKSQVVHISAAWQVNGSMSGGDIVTPVKRLL